MIGSRLRQRRVTVTIAVYAKTLGSGQHTEATALTGLTATHDPKGGDEIAADAGEMVIVSDAFWFEPVSGSLPAITAEHVLVDGGGTRYEVVAAPVDQAGGGNRLKVMCRRVG